MNNSLLIQALNFHKNNNLEQAKKLYLQFLKSDPEHPVANQWLGILYSSLDDIDNAIFYLEKSVEIEPEAQKLFDIAELYNKKEDKNKVIELLTKAANLQPHNELINLKLGCAHQDLKQFDQAIFRYEKVISINPQNEEAYSRIAYIFHIVQLFRESALFAQKALNINPNNTGNMAILGVSLLQIREIFPAIEILHKTLKLSPDNHFARYYLGCAYIYDNDFDNCWKYYDEGRIKLWNYQNLKFPEEKIPKWKGEDIQGKTIYVYETGGIGDTIHFARYLPLLAAMGAKIICKQRACLDVLFRENDLKAEVIDNSTPDESLAFDYQVPYMTLPASFNASPANIPFKDGYLYANPEKVKFYKENYFNNERFKIGIVWAGSGGNPARDIDIMQFIPLAELENVQLYSLQKNNEQKSLSRLPESVKIIPLGQTFKDFSDTAAAIENTDLVISIDTSVIHLAGAMGKKTWCTLAYYPDWRWGFDTENTFWYNSVRLFRQTKPGIWEGVIQNIYTQLKTERVGFEPTMQLPT